MQFPITIGLHRSRFLDGFLLLGAMTASLIVARFPIAIDLRGSLLLAVWVCSAIAWYRLSPQCAAIRLDRGGQLWVALRGADEFSLVELLPGAIVHPWLTVVRWRRDDGQMGILTAAIDSANKEDFRRLRVFLRWQADFNATDDAV